MKAVYSYIILDRFWKKRTEDFFKLARLSVNYTKKIYPTVLYTDTRSKEIFDKNGVIFDEYVVNDDYFKEVNEHTYGLSKFIVFLKEESPYVTLDLDTIIFSKLYSNNPVTYGYKEIDFAAVTGYEEKQLHIKYLKKYYWKYNSLVESKLKEKNIEHSIDTYPSNSLMIVNNPSLVKECAKQVINLIDKDYRKYTVQFYEQYLLYLFLRKYSPETGFVTYDNPDTAFKDFEKGYELGDVLRHKFLHLDRYDRDDNVKKIINELHDNLVG